MRLHLELPWHVALEVEAVAVVALEELDYDLSGLLENGAALELLSGYRALSACRGRWFFFSITWTK